MTQALVSLDAALKNGWRGLFCPTSSDSDSTASIVIGIDFGTTFTGVAYAFTDSLNENEIRINSETRNELETVVEKITVLKQWPNVSQQFAEKTPTHLAYNSANGKVVSWGGLVGPAHASDTTIGGFKLGLHSGARHHYTTAAASRLGGFLGDANWRHPNLPSKTAVDFAADYLALVGNHVMNEVLPQQFDESFLRNKRVSFVLTVPAIWTEGAKDATCRAAVRAGIPLEQLTLITEPEAAAHYCTTICTEVNLGVGDYFIVCDAGGGTVDLISYKVATLNPFKVVEAAGGTGAACGAMYLGDGFNRLLRQKLGSRAEEILKPKTLREASRSFETQIKCQFNPLGSSEESYEVPIPGAPDIPEIGLEGGFLTFSWQEIDSFFLPIFDQIYDLINGQIQSVSENANNAEAKIKTVFMVGGFGSNEYLSQYLRNKLPEGIEVKKPHAGWTAINRGAVLHMLGLNLVRERIMRRHYGFAITSPFIEDKDPERLKFRDINGDLMCKNVMRWYAHKDQSMPDGFVVQAPFVTLLRPEEYFTSSIPCLTALRVCDDGLAPDYNNSAVSQISTLKVDLKDLPPTAFTQMERTDGGIYYIAHYQIGMKFGSMLEFEMLCEGRVVGSVVTNYV